MQHRNNTARMWVPALAAALVFAVAPQSLAGHLEPFKAIRVAEMNPLTPEKVELGKKLFFDRRLSGDGTMSCATCHIPELAFTDGQAISLSYPTTKNWRNAPTLINAAFSTFLFHDGRSSMLEDQALFPIMSNFEMNQNLDFLEEELRSVPEYRAEFEKVFGTPDTSRERVAMALAAFERTLVSGDAPIDAFLNGDDKALSQDARKGLEIFRGKGKCNECHYGVNLADSGFYALNVPNPPEFDTDPDVAATRRFVAKVNHYPDYQTLKEDPGRYLITKDDKDWKAFKTPTLREIAKTAPYMHNGIFDDLDMVIAFFDQGGGAGNTALKPLGLSDEDRRVLKVFLTEALSGSEKEFVYPAIP